MSDDTESKEEGLDYGEPHDITALHTAVVRENEEPHDGLEPLSLWVISACGALLMFGGVYMGLFSGGFNPEVYNERSGGFSFGGKSSSAATTAGAPAPISAAALGEKVYKQNCISCHQATGSGVPGQYPPLGGSEWVNGNDHRLTMILLKGLQGPIKVAGATYNGAMPQWEKGLTDEKLAAVMTYIRSSWGNSAPPISVDGVKWAREKHKDRAESWIEADLLAVTEALPAAAAPPPEAPAAGAPPAEAPAPSK